MTKHTIKPEDIELFRQSVKGVKPLVQNTIDPVHPKRRKRRVIHDDLPVRADDFGASAFLPEVSESDDNFIQFRRPGLQDRLYQKLQRGQIPISAELDLHGMTADKARLAFDRFMEQLKKRGRQQCVRIIHGKGYGSKDRIPVIKRHTQSWLQCNMAVLAYCSCRPEDGGTGAVYVLVKNSD